ncbi:hypothetical protein EDB92DRAFT_1946834 [Lactarius akahatsu]|uniref:Uncharacterized protein n=1 Tax=Lactarius akahatsu TaxID=416441 RepID=A0AAD4LE25_9AGAM|nr:hypothetical protein EDB92DRAFT_1946834 [Lactarius akahatsu]
MILEVVAAPSVTAPMSESVSQSSIGHPTLYTGQHSELQTAHENTATAPGGGSGAVSSEVYPSPFLQGLPPQSQEGTSTVKKGKEREDQEATNQSHPYAAVREGEAASKPAVPTMHKNEQAYTTTAKIHDKKVTQEVYKCAMETPITVTQCELLSLAPELHAQVADVTIKCCIPHDTTQTLLKEAEEAAEEDRTREGAQLAHMPTAFAAAARPPTSTSPQGIYAKAAADAQETQDKVEVATESNALHTILPVVDGQEHVEVILDPGCQIVAMSEEVCNVLALAYDPSIKLNMILANRSVNQLLGLARNVAFSISDITLYMQVHILQSPAYNILLGRPFDILTQSVVRNYCNKNQSITICNPNTRKTVTVPTTTRGTQTVTVPTTAHSTHRFTDRCEHQQKQDF